MTDILQISLAQVVGLIALVFLLLAFQLNQRSKLITAQLISVLLYALHFYLLGAYTGAVINLCSVARNYTFIKYRQQYDFPWILLFFILIFVGLALFAWEGPVSFLALFGVIIGTIGFWQKETRFIRLFSSISVLFWFLYSYFELSYSGMLGSGFVFISICIAGLRHDIIGSAQAKHKV